MTSEDQPTYEFLDIPVAVLSALIQNKPDKIVQDKDSLKWCLDRVSPITKQTFILDDGQRIHGILEKKFPGLACYVQAERKIAALALASAKEKVVPASPPPKPKPKPLPNPVSRQQSHGMKSTTPPREDIPTSTKLRQPTKAQLQQRANRRAKKMQARLIQQRDETATIKKQQQQQPKEGEEWKLQIDLEEPPILPPTEEADQNVLFHEEGIKEAIKTLKTWKQDEVEKELKYAWTLSTTLRKRWNTYLLSFGALQKHYSHGGRQLLYRLLRPSTVFATQAEEWFRVTKEKYRKLIELAEDAEKNKLLDLLDEGDEAETITTKRPRKQVMLLYFSILNQAFNKLCVFEKELKQTLTQMKVETPGLSTTKSLLQATCKVERFEREGSEEGEMEKGEKKTKKEEEEGEAGGEGGKGEKSDVEKQQKKGMKSKECDKAVLGHGTIYAVKK